MSKSREIGEIDSFEQQEPEGHSGKIHSKNKHILWEEDKETKGWS